METFSTLHPLVCTGLHQVVRVAIRLLEDRGAECAAKLAALGGSIDAGMAELDGGDIASADEVFEEVKVVRVLHEGKDVEGHEIG